MGWESIDSSQKQEIWNILRKITQRIYPNGKNHFSEKYPEVLRYEIQHTGFKQVNLKNNQ